MAVTLRLQRHGQKRRPFYRIVATETEARRDGKFLEIVGTYNPMVNPPAVNLKEDKIRKWVLCGAKQTQVVRDLLNKNIPGLVEEKEKHQKEKTIARRAKRRAAVKARPKREKASKDKKKKSA